MGLPQFPTALDGVLPMLVLNTVLSVSLLKNLVWHAVQAMGVGNGGNHDVSSICEEERVEDLGRQRRVSITQFKCLTQNYCDSENGSSVIVECRCCVCLCQFEDEEEVSELSCKHYFRRCLDKWFGNYKHSTCPICRSIL